MIPNSQQLALRNKAAAALVGALPSTFGAERHASRSADRSPYAATSFGADFGEDVYGADFGYASQFGAGSVQDATSAIQHVAPSHADLQRAHAQLMRKKAGTARRLALLNPNMESEVDVEAYVFSLNPSQFATGSGLTWGTANGWTAFKNPQVAFRAERIFVNVKIPGLVYINTIQAANVNAQIGGVADGFTFTPAAMSSRISLPTLPPQNTMQVTGTWSNVVDTPFIAGQAFALVIDFQGWATVTPK